VDPCLLDQGAGGRDAKELGEHADELMVGGYPDGAVGVEPAPPSPAAGVRHGLVTIRRAGVQVSPNRRGLEGDTAVDQLHHAET
jgi:hypothetical protein